MQTRYAKKLSVIRKSTVEPVLGTLINFLNMKRLNSKGIRQASKHVLMAALCYNLKKYMKYVQKKTMIIVMEQLSSLFNESKSIEMSFCSEFKSLLALNQPPQNLVYLRI
jgi:hypothetical protein